MQHKQFNFVWRGIRLAAFIGPLFLAGPVLAGAITQPSRPDPLLDGGPTDPCAAGVDYASSVDVNGQGVIPADVAARPVPVPDTIAIPIGRNPAPQTQGTRRPSRRGSNPVTDNTGSNRDSAYVALDGRKLEPLLNPPPCRPVY